jgi:hypothetical protein
MNRLEPWPILAGVVVESAVAIALAMLYVLTLFEIETSRGTPDVKPFAAPGLLVDALLGMPSTVLADSLQHVLQRLATFSMGSSWESQPLFCGWSRIGSPGPNGRQLGTTPFQHCVCHPIDQLRRLLRVLVADPYRWLAVPVSRARHRHDFGRDAVIAQHVRDQVHVPILGHALPSGQEALVCHP